MIGARWTSAAVAGIAVAAGLTACSDDTAPQPDPADSAGSATVQTPASSECDRTPDRGTIERTGYGLRYTTGSLTVSLRPADGAASCLRFTKSGPADPQVPPDSLLFTFSGGPGQGAQLEFLAVDLSPAILPPLGDGQVRRYRQVSAPIPAQVGVAVHGNYFHTDHCTLALAAVSKARAAGRFDCPQAYASPANPFDPSDDVDYEGQDTPHPATAALSGWFEIRP
ncbi:hypothetical protein [Gordonia sp. VNK21]|uniref:hypothetical protein n=1 Tax=Gordonia sp. VNK21 TaxID=3382483 RepID=UPI0038D44E31